MTEMNKVWVAAVLVCFFVGSSVAQSCTTTADCATYFDFDLYSLGTPCITGYACTLGVCEYATDDSVCLDGNPCTANTCVPLDATYTGIANAFGCLTTELPDTTPCTNGDACTTGEQCTTGECGGGALTVCDSFDVCIDDWCDSQTGMCVADFNTSPCEDGLDCTVDSVCDLGTCTGGDPLDVLCVGNSACESASCLIGIGCEYVQLAVGTQCVDEANVDNFCKVNSVCNAIGDCKSSERDCSDGNLCTHDSCSEDKSSCRHIERACLRSPEDHPVVDGEGLPTTTTSDDGYCDVVTGECVFPKKTYRAISISGLVIACVCLLLIIIIAITATVAIIVKKARNGRDGDRPMKKERRRSEKSSTEYR